MQTQENTLLLPCILQTISDEIQGENWKKRSFLVTTKGQYPKEVLFAIWNNSIEQILRCQAGDHLEVFFNVQSKCINERYFTELTAYRVNINFKETAQAKEAQTV